MKKDLYLINLFGLYGNLLTEHQKDLFNLHYECDLSFGEIAEIKQISRQSVNDGLKKAKDFLMETENKLKFAEKFSLLDDVLNAEHCGDYSAEQALEKINSILEDIKWRSFLD